jgi:hypothetical protein
VAIVLVILLVVGGIAAAWVLAGRGPGPTRYGSNVDAADTVQNVALVPLNTTVLVATGSKSSEVAQHIISVNFQGGHAEHVESPMMA